MKHSEKRTSGGNSGAPGLNMDSSSVGKIHLDAAGCADGCLHSTVRSQPAKPSWRELDKVMLVLEVLVIEVPDLFERASHIVLTSATVCFFLIKKRKIVSPRREIIPRS